MGFSAVGIIKAQGHSGGIWVLITENGNGVKVIHRFQQCISFEISCVSNV